MASLSSRQNPVVQRYRHVARGDERGLMLLDGAHLIDEALRAGVVLRHAMVAAEALLRHDIAALTQRLQEAGVDFVTVTAPVLAAASPVRTPSGIVALGDRPGSQANLFDASGDPLVVAASDIQDPGNLGAIIRVAEAGAATAVAVCGTSTDPFGWKCLRGSMGSALRVPMAIGAPTEDVIAEAHRHRCRVVATVPRDGLPLFDFNLRGAVLLLIGGEGSGLPESIVDLADARVTIPMQAPVESLNAAVTTALIVYEANRQRRGAGGFSVS